LQFNIYITPANAQGFAPHYDDHDVFILQTTGTKIWRLYHSPIELPSPKQPHCKHKDKYELGTPAFEVELKPGDLLYIHRGLIHDASTTDTASVHITLGLHPNYWFELLREVADLAEDKAEFRRAVPNALMDEPYKHQFKEEFRQRLQALIDDLDVDELLARKSEQYISNKRSEDQNRFKDSIQLEGATSAPKARYQEGLTWQALAPKTKLLDNETGRGSKTYEQAYPVYGKKERSY